MLKKIIFIIKSVMLFPLFACGGGPPPVQPYKPAPKLEDPSVQEALRKEKELAGKRRGRQSTILTPMATDQNQPKTLLGA